MRIAVVFDNQLRPETTGFYVCRALHSFDIEHILPHELPHVTKGLFDLFLFVDDGLDYCIPDLIRPRAAWAIDTHIDIERSLKRFGDADWVYAAQRQGAEAMQAAMGRLVTWLPLACDPGRHKRLVNESPLHDLCFIGHEVGARRIELLSRLRSRFQKHWFGQAFQMEMARRYSQSRVAFNCSVNNDINMRVFEAMACGVPLVTDCIEANGMEELFEVGEHMLCYADFEDLTENIERLLENEPLRRRQAANALALVTSNHTYSHRVKVIADEVTKSRTQHFTPPRRKNPVPAKTVAYFEFDRPDVAALVPLSARTILDIGCGAGRLGALIKSRQECHVTGVEMTSLAASSARERLDHVIEGGIESVAEGNFEPGHFDSIIFADVLEHLRHPKVALQRCNDWLENNGTLVVSVPNSRHHSVVRGLIVGNWTYEHAGLLDEDHVRCFTRRELEKLLFCSGFEVTDWAPVWGSGKKEWDQAGQPGQLDFGNFQVRDLSTHEAEEFFVYQYVVAARKRPVISYGVTSIVICTHNQLDYTRQCVESILARTDVPYELIFVDNHSTDATVEYLRTIEGAKVILNRENRGFAPACNQGIEIATGQQILLLNNDTIVTTGWLELLLEALYDQPNTGMVGPVSNNVSGPQQIESSYRDLASLDGFAWARRDKRRLVEADRLVGFCLLMRRELVDRIGVMDERFEIGCFEDDDYCKRAIQAGFKIYFACHAFVHHFGSVTFKASGIDFEALMEKNQQRFEAKWATNEVENARMGEVQKIPSRELGYFKHSLPNGEFLLQRQVVHLSLCMIVRDNEDTICACLESIYPWVDEIIIVDTGSRDRTISICEQFGARILHFPWCDDFSAARNVSLEPANGDWIFWMDSDDIIHEEQGQQLRAIAYSDHNPETLGYIVQVHCPSGDDGQMTVVDHVKLIRNSPKLRFEHRIHEQILPSIRRVGGRVEFTNISVVHAGSRQSAETRAKKLERDFRILALDLQEHPEHPFVLFNLGMTCEDAGEYERAEQYLRRCIEVSQAGESQLRKAWALRVSCSRELGRIDEALQLADESLQLFPGDKELLFRRAVLQHDLGQFECAINDYRAVLNDPVDRQFQSIDPSICGCKARHNLAIAQLSIGKIDDAIVSLNEAVKEQPEFGPAWLALVRCYANAQNMNQAQTTLSNIPESIDPFTRSLSFALVDEACGRLDDAARLLENLAWDGSSFEDQLDDVARIFVNSGHYATAIPILERLRQLRPVDAATLHNLGVCFRATGQFETAVAALRQSISLRPDSPSTSGLLSDLYQQFGIQDLADNVLEHATQHRTANASLDAKPQNGIQSSRG